MTRASLVCAATLSLFLALPLSPATAQPAPLQLRYGPERMIFGSCRPSLMLLNGSKQTLDYVQVDVLYRLKDGREVLAEHKSRYRTGVENPVRPGELRLLVIHHDESVPLGASCPDILAARIAKVECKAVADATCTAIVPAVGDILPTARR